MKSGFIGDFRSLEGRIRGLLIADDRIEFVVAQRRAELRKSRVTAALRNGDHVNLVLGDSLFGQHAILALHRMEDGATEYTGPMIGVKSILVSAIVFSLAVYLQNPWLVILAVLPVSTLALVFRRDRTRVLSYLRTHLQRDCAESSDEVPLSLGAAIREAHSAGWPAEILDFTHDAIIIWEMDGAGIVFWNRAAERIYGYTREQAHGKVTHDLLKTQIEGGIGELESRLERFGMWIGTLRHTRSDGQIVHVEGRLALVAQEQRPWLVLEVNRDVTDHKRAEAEEASLARQLRRLRSLSAGTLE
jgi:PAS domain S-box-containing protein